MRALLAEEYAARGRLEEALDLVPSPTRDAAPQVVAVRARLLVRLGRPREALGLTLDSRTAPLTERAAQSLAVSHALAFLADYELIQAAETLAPFADLDALETQLATVVIHLAGRDYEAADSVLVRLEGLSGRSDDIRLLRAQIHLEPGELDGLDRGESLLRRLARPKDDALHSTPDAHLPDWLRLQCELRAEDDRFGFVWAVWAALSNHPEALSVLSEAKRASTTFLQDATMDALWGEVLASRGDQVAAAAKLAAASSGWKAYGGFDRAISAAERAERLDPSTQFGLAADVLVDRGRSVLAEETQESMTEALELAREAWKRGASEGAAVLWAEVVVRQTYADDFAGDDDPLLEVLDILSNVEQTPGVTGCRGWVLLRLGELAQKDRHNYSFQAIEWLLATALRAPDEYGVLQWLAWSLAAVNANRLALIAGQCGLTSAGRTTRALETAIATLLNQFGSAAPVEDLIDELEETDESMTPWIHAVRLKIALLGGRHEVLRELLDHQLDDDSLWTVSTVADAHAVLEDAAAAQTADRSIRAAIDQGAFASAARSELLRGRPAEALELCRRARTDGTDLPEVVDYVEAQARLISGDATAESVLLTDIARNSCWADLQEDIAVDCPLLVRALEPDSPSALALGRVQDAARARLTMLGEEPPEAVSSDLEECGRPRLVALAELWVLQIPGPDSAIARYAGGVPSAATLVEVQRSAQDADPAAAWALLGPALEVVRTHAGSDPLGAVILKACEAVEQRCAEDALREVVLGDTASAPLGVEVSLVRQWLTLTQDDAWRAEGRALVAFDLVISGGVDPGEAARRSGLTLSGQQAPDWLAGRWAEHIRNPSSWWRVHDLLAPAIAPPTWHEIRAGLVDRLSEICGLGPMPLRGARGPISVLLGPTLVPEDRSDEWIMLKQYVPSIRETILDVTGVVSPGYNFRFDDSGLDDAVTYLLNERVTEFARLSRIARVEPVETGEGHRINDPVTGRPLWLVPDSRLSSPDEPAPGSAGSSSSLTWLVGRHLLAWSLKHADTLYQPYDVGMAAGNLPELAAQLDDPQVVLAWLDAARAALRAGRKLDIGIMSGVFLGPTAKPPDRRQDELLEALDPQASVPEDSL